MEDAKGMELVSGPGDACFEGNKTINKIRVMWDKYHHLQAKKISDLGTVQIKELLRPNPPQFARGKLFHQFEWIPIESTFEFWKSEVQAHLAEPNQKIFLEDFPGEYAYRASLWELDGRQIIFLEMNH